MVAKNQTGVYIQPRERKKKKEKKRAFVITTKVEWLLKMTKGKIAGNNAGFV